MKPFKFELKTDVLKESGLPKKFWNLQRSDYYGNKAALSIVEKYLLHADQHREHCLGLLFLGKMESGKTFLITYALKFLIAKGFTVSYTTLPKLFDMSYSADENERAIMETEFGESHFIAVDGIDSGNLSGKVDGSLKVLWRLLKFARDEGKPVFLGCGFNDSPLLMSILSSRLPELPDLLMISTETVFCSSSSFAGSERLGQLRNNLKQAGAEHVD